MDISLEDYLDWMMNKMPFYGSIPYKNPIWMVENVTSVLIHRERDLQTQMFIVPPDTIIPEHTHPNVDSFEVYGGGEIYFTHGGKFVSDKKLVKENEHKNCYLRGVTIRVKPNDKHGGTFGKEGGIFFSVQKWLNGVQPHCVASDYIGKTMGEHHLGNVKYGDAYFDSPLEPLDAMKSNKKHKKRGLIPSIFKW